MSLRAIENGFAFFRVTGNGYSALFDAYGIQISGGYNVFDAPPEDIGECDTKCPTCYPICYKNHIISVDIPMGAKKFTIYPYTHDLFEISLLIFVILEIFGTFVYAIVNLMKKAKLLKKFRLPK